MLSEDFDNTIFRYFSTDVYPKHVLDAKNCSHAKKNFRVKASQFQIGVDGNATDESKPGRNTEFLFKCWNI